MKYSNIKKVKFLDRPNRFVANVEDEKGEILTVHVKNTGRCRELLIKGCDVYIWKSDNPLRKTKYDLISVQKGAKLINMDSQIPNTVFKEWVENSGFFKDITLIKPEKFYGESRFDFYIETASDKIFIEIKGVTLEENGVVMFPDAPTERGVKHIHHLEKCVKDGYKACIFFIIQMNGVKYFTPNIKTHPEFAKALKNAKANGVNIYALDCIVTPDSIKADKFVDIKL